MHVLDTKIDSSHSQEPLGRNPHLKLWPESPAIVIFPSLHKETQKNPEFPGLYPEFPDFSCPDYPDTYPEYPGTHRTHPTFSYLIALHLLKSNTHMYYMSRLFYHGFCNVKACLVISFAYHYNHSWHIYLSSIIALV